MNATKAMQPIQCNQINASGWIQVNETKWMQPIESGNANKWMQPNECKQMNVSERMQLIECFQVDLTKMLNVLDFCTENRH